MASNFKISEAARTAACDAIVDLVDGGSDAGTLEFRTGNPPATPATEDSGTLLAELTLPDPAFGDASSGTATANNITSVTAAASGDAGHFRVKDSDGNVIFQGTAGEAADTPDATFDEKSIVQGGQVSVTNGQFTVTVPVGGA